MDIVFQSPGAPGRRHLHDAFAENKSEALSALVSATCDAIFTTPFLPQRLFLASFKPLEELESRFRMHLTGVNFDLTFTRKERDVIQDASNGLYHKDDIESTFYRHGGYNGIVALVLYFRSSEKILKNWAVIFVGFHAWLVKRVVQMLSRETVEGILQYRLNSEPLTLHPLQYLGSHAGRKRKREVSEIDRIFGTERL